MQTLYNGIMHSGGIGFIFQMLSLVVSLVILPLVFFLLFTNSLVRQSILRLGVMETLTQIPKTLSCSMKNDTERTQYACMGWGGMTQQPYTTPVRR